MPISHIPTWRVIIRLARFKPALYLASGLMASIMFYLFPLVPGVIVRRFFDELTGEAPATVGLTTLLLLLVAASVGRVTTLMMAGMAENTLHLVVATLLRKNLLAHLLSYPGARALPASPGEAISRFRDDVQNIVGFLSWTIDPVGQAAVTIVALVVLASINPLITLAVIVPLVVTVLVVNMATKRIQLYRRANQQAIGEVTGLLGEVFGAALAVKVASAESRVVKYFESVNEARRKAALRDTLFTEILNSISANASNLGVGVLLLVAAQTMQTGRFSVGDFALFVSYLSWLTIVTTFFGGYLTRYRQTGVSVERLLALLQGAPAEALTQHGPVHLLGELPGVPHHPKTETDRLETLTASGLTYHYPGSARGIEGVSLSLRRGSFTVITGRIGSGKTTLLRVLLGLLPKAGGVIRWNDRIVDDPATFFVPPRCAYTPQVPRLFSETLRDNIVLGLPLDQIDLPAALERAVMERDVPELDQGLDTLIGPRGVKLSGGQAQRTAAARMFVREPELLVFDDLSSALDVETERLLWERMRDGGERVNDSAFTCLVVSHRRAALRQADRLVVLKDGRVEDEGTLEELLERCEEMQLLWRGEIETTGVS